MKKYFLLLSALLLTGCSCIDSTKVFDDKQAATLVHNNFTGRPASQRISLALPRQQHWKHAYLASNQVGYPVVLIPASQSRENYCESIQSNIVTYQKHPRASARLYVENLFEQAERRCQFAEVRILSQNNQGIVYSINTSQCAWENSPWQIGKAFNGIDAVYLVRYVANKEIPADEKKLMAQSIQHAELVLDPRSLMCANGMRG